MPLTNDIYYKTIKSIKNYTLNTYDYGNQTMSRRKFLKDALLAIGVGQLAACKSNATPTTKIPSNSSQPPCEGGYSNSITNIFDNTHNIKK